MEKKLFEKKIIRGMIPFVLAVVLISVSFQACQKDEILQNVNSETEAIQPFQLKSATFSAGDIDALILKIESFLIKGDLEPGLANAFTVKLENAKKSLEKGNEKASANQLQSLMNQITDLLSEGTIKTTIGEVIIFDMKLIAGENPTFTDTRDNHEYKTIKIGDQVWMAENLAYLPAVNPSSSISSTVPMYYVYGYEGTDVATAKQVTNCATYGVLYNWPAAKSACPDGWHIPADAEWTQLANFLINNGYGYGGDGNDIAKALAATSGWVYSGTEGTPGNNILSNNTCGFSGLPGGDCHPTKVFEHIGDRGFWWSSTEITVSFGTYQWSRILASNYSSLTPSYFYKGYGFSVRCIRD